MLNSFRNKWFNLFLSGKKEQIKSKPSATFPGHIWRKPETLIKKKDLDTLNTALDLYLLAQKSANMTI